MPWQLRYRTLPILLVVAAAAAAVVVLQHRSSSPSHPEATAVPAHAAAKTPAQHAKSVPLQPGVSKVVLRFVKTAVMREHANRQTLLDAWKLTGPQLRQGTTLRQWLAGTSSVVPFPDGAVAPGLKIDHSYANDALLELALYPRKTTSGVPPGVFLIGLHRYGSKWLVDYWAPHGASSTPAADG
jgi:hypothetical protein